MNRGNLRHLIAAVSVVAILVCYPPLRAQTLAFDHVDVTVPDAAQAAEWYIKYMGGAKTGRANEVAFGPTVFIFRQSTGALPSAGSVIDHVGFSFPDLDMNMAEWQTAGIKIVMPVREVPGLFKLGFIEDPWGSKLKSSRTRRRLGSIISISPQPIPRQCSSG